ncbi:hypothetical protein AOLI_G00036670 [Acnodon oligacanthus]
MRPCTESRSRFRFNHMLPLAVGCLLSTVWGSDPDDLHHLSSSTFSHSENQHQHHQGGGRHHLPHISIYRSPASLRGGHSEYLSCFMFTFQQDIHLREFRLSPGLRTQICWIPL